HSFCGILASSASECFPALLTSTSSRLCLPRMPSTAFCQEAGCVTSSSTTSERPANSADSWRARSLFRCTPNQRKLVWDSWRNARAIARPRPPLVPVTRMTLVSIVSLINSCRPLVPRPSSLVTVLLAEPRGNGLLIAAHDAYLGAGKPPAGHCLDCRDALPRGRSHERFAANPLW